MTHDEPTPSDDGAQTSPERDADILKAYREVAELCRWIPGEGQEAVDARLSLFHAFGRLAELEESIGQNAAGLAARESATSMIRQVQKLTGDHVHLRLMEASQLSSRGFTLREMENWTDALEIYNELAALLDDGADGSATALSLMGAAQDGIGDIQFRTPSGTRRRVMPPGNARGYCFSRPFTRSATIPMRLFRLKHCNLCSPM